jgi:hypothetical protein
MAHKFLGAFAGCIVATRSEKMIKTTLAITATLLFATSAFGAPIVTTAKHAAPIVTTAKHAGPVVMTATQMDAIVAGVQPANPGGFGQDRAAWIAANGGAAWGAIASDRAGDNGAINQAYMRANGDLPAGVTPGQVK